MSNKKTLAIDARMISASGIGVVIRNILPVLTNDFFIYLIGDKNKLVKFKETLKVEIIHTKSSIYSIKILFQYPFFPKTDLLWVPHFNVPILSNAKIRVVTIHDTYHLDNFNKLNFKQKVFAKIFYFLAIKLSNHVFTVSHFTRSRVMFFFNIDPSKISVIYPGAKRLLRPQTKKRGKFFLFVGNLKPHKNVKNLIYAYSALTEKIKKELKLVIVGKSTGFINPDEDLKQLVIDLGLIEKIDFLEDLSNNELSELYYNSEFLIFPSTYEGFGLPILEAFSTKTPVICSNLDVFREVSGNAALFFNPFSIEDIVGKIVTLHQSESLKRDLIHRGSKKLKQFSWNKCQNQYLQAFKKLTKHE